MLTALGCGCYPNRLGGTYLWFVLMGMWTFDLNRHPSCQSRHTKFGCSTKTPQSTELRVCFTVCVRERDDMQRQSYIQKHTYIKMTNNWPKGTYLEQHLIILMPLWSRLVHYLTCSCSKLFQFTKAFILPLPTNLQVTQFQCFFNKKVLNHSICASLLISGACAVFPEIFPMCFYCSLGRHDWSLPHTLSLSLCTIRPPLSSDSKYRKFLLKSNASTVGLSSLLAVACSCKNLYRRSDMIPAVTLNNGAKMPMMGLGTWRVNMSLL